MVKKKIFYYMLFLLAIAKADRDPVLKSQTAKIFSEESIPIFRKTHQPHRATDLDGRPVYGN